MHQVPHAIKAQKNVFWILETVLRQLPPLVLPCPLPEALKHHSEKGPAPRDRTGPGLAWRAGGHMCARQRGPPVCSAATAAADPPHPEAPDPHRPSRAQMHPSSRQDHPSQLCHLPCQAGHRPQQGEGLAGCRCRPHAGLLDAAAHTLACPAFEGPAAARGDSWCRAEQPRQTPGSRHPCGRVRQLPIRTTGRAAPDQGPAACRQQCVWGPRGGPPGPSTIPVESHEAKLLSPEHGIGPRRPRGLGSTPLGPRRQLCSAGAPGPGPHGCPARHSHWPMWGQSNPP